MTLIQRFGSALNLSVHLHMIIPDGVYTLERSQPRFHRLNAPDRQHLEKLLKRIIARVMRCLVKHGLQRRETEPKPFTVGSDGFSLNLLSRGSRLMPCTSKHRFKRLKTISLPLPDDW